MDETKPTCRCRQLSWFAWDLWASSCAIVNLKWSFQSAAPTGLCSRWKKPPENLGAHRSCGFKPVNDWPEALSRQVVRLFAAASCCEGHYRTTERSPLRSRGQAFRTDTKCDEKRVILGGWELGENADPKEAMWFAVEVDLEETPLAELL